MEETTCFELLRSFLLLKSVSFLQNNNTIFDFSSGFLLKLLFCLQMFLPCYMRNGNLQLKLDPFYLQNVVIFLIYCFCCLFSCVLLFLYLQMALWVRQTVVVRYKVCNMLLSRIYRIFLLVLLCLLIFLLICDLEFITINYHFYLPRGV